MALLPSEVIRLKAELGFNVLTVGAEPYIGVTSIFDQVIAPNLTAGAVTTSSTTVSERCGPQQATIALASATGFTVGARVVLDVDNRQETATLESLSGASATLLLSNQHSGTYPVTVEGGESIVREYLANIRAVKAKMFDAFGEGMLKQVDEVQFYQSGKLTLFGSLGTQLAFWRDELASVIGIPSLWSLKQASGSRLAVY